MALIKNSLLAALVLAAASAAAQDNTLAFSERWARAETQNADVEAQLYGVRLRKGGVWNDAGTLRGMTSPHEKAILECVTAMVPTPSPVRLVFTLDKAGTVTQATTDQDGYIAECLPRKTLGMRVPAPPSDDFLLCHRFEKLDGDRTVSSTCGPRPIVESCEQRGSTSTCRIERR